MPQTLECADLSALSSGDFVAVKCDWSVRVSGEPLNAALPGRQAGQAAKAVTGHRTPKLRVNSQLDFWPLCQRTLERFKGGFAFRACQYVTRRADAFVARAGLLLHELDELHKLDHRVHP